MKNLLYILIIASFCSCSKDFLDRNPTTDLNNNTFWNTEADLKSFSNGIYNDAGNNALYTFYLGFTNIPFGSATHAVVPYEVSSDNHASLAAEHIAFARVSAGQNFVATNASDAGWNWGILRKCNIMLRNYTKAQILESIRNNYAGEAYFFRAWFYLDKVQNFGDVPYVSKPLDNTSEELFEARQPRKQVMDSVLRDIDMAINYLPTSWSTPGRVNKYVALALKSRLCLYEGTYRKYHNLGDYEKYLNQCVDASAQLMSSGKYSLYKTGNTATDYKTLFVTKDLSTNPEVIFSRAYVQGVLTHNMSGYVASQLAGPTRDFVEDFLCLESDGSAKPVALSTAYSNNTMEAEFNNRDPRLKQIVLDPREEQAVFKTQVGYPRLQGMQGNVSPTGYHLIKYYDYNQMLLSTNQDTDAPLFRYAEVLLNFIEAKAVLGQATKTDLDQSVNLVRRRSGIPDLTMTPVADPKYAALGLDPLIIEIRRERRVELCYEQLRYQDLMRWKMGAQLNKQVLGIRFEPSDRANPKFAAVSSSVKTTTVNGKNYIDVLASSELRNRKFTESKNYLFPIPINVISKNPAIGQNPDW